LRGHTGGLPPVRGANGRDLACVAEKVTYSCDANGTLIATPSGACANEDAACLSCTNDVFGCFSGD